MITAFQRDLILNSLGLVGGAYEEGTLYLGLFTAINDAGLATLFSDLTLPPAGGLDPGFLDPFGEPYVMTDGRAVLDAPPVVFRPNDSTEAATVLGWWLANDPVTGDLQQFGYFDQPVALPDEFSALSVVFRVTVDPNGRWDATISYDG